MIRHRLDRMLRIVLALVCCVMLLSLGTQAFNLTSTIREKNRTDFLKQRISPGESSEIKGQDLSEFADLSKAPLFFPAPSKNLPPPQLNGLLGQYAVINGQIAGAGDTVDNWKIDKIENGKVFVVHDEQREELQLQAGSQTLVIDSRGDKKDVSLNQQQQQQPARGGRGGQSGGQGRGETQRPQEEKNKPEKDRSQEEKKPEKKNEESAREENAAAEKQSPQPLPSIQEMQSMPRKQLKELLSSHSTEELAEHASKETGRTITPDQIRKIVEAIQKDE